MIGIVVSRADEASIHIGEHLRNSTDWEKAVDPDYPDAAGGEAVYRTDGIELREFDDLHIELEGASDPFSSPELLVFASRHSGETGPLLSAHFTGNFGPGEFGGEAGAFAMAAPAAQKHALSIFEDVAPAEYEVAMECTHHGPTDVDVPSLFVEIGSDTEQWRDDAAAAAAAEAILSLRDIDPTSDRTVVGFGGGHYAPRFRRIIRETDWAVGHIGADWSLEAMDGLDQAILQRAFERSGATRALIDGERPELAETIESLGYRRISETWLRETDGIPLETVDNVEAHLTTVDAGTRFGEHARASDEDEWDVIELDSALVDTVNGIDIDRAVETAATNTVAYMTEENGNRLADRIIVPDDESYTALIDAFTELLAQKYDRVERTTDELRCHERAFDPNRARELGVDPGPAFGRLADGESVETNGKTVTPEQVHEKRIHSYRI
ncbi:MAG: D-aminoacyl-tRNA deacylase [Halobacteriales archaeon]